MGRYTGAVIQVVLGGPVYIVRGLEGGRYVVDEYRDGAMRRLTMTASGVDWMWCRAWARLNA